MVMNDMQAVYDEELGRGRGGLMSLMRGMGDFTLGEDIMNNLPEIIAMLRNTNKDTLTMRQTQEMGKPSELAVSLSDEPALSSMVGPEMALLAGMMGGPGGKAKGLASLKDELAEFIKKDTADTAERMRRLDQDETLSRLADQDRLERTRAEQLEGLRNLENRNRRLEDGEMSEEYETALREYQDFMNRQGESGIQKLRKEIFSDPDQMAGGGRPGLYANIAAKRRRIAAGSGEKMRKAGSKGAPTKENFRQAETTVKKYHGGAVGGGIGYKKGYYGKSYK
jgi:hypothetical protein